MLLTNNANDNESFEREVPPAGLQKAVYIGYIDLGILPTGFKDEKTGEEKKAQKINMVWQLEEKQANGRPFLVFDRLTAKWFKDPKKNKKSKLRERFEGWQGELPDTFDISSLVGKSAMLTLIHNVSQKNGETYANIGAVSPLPKKDKEELVATYAIQDGKPVYQEAELVAAGGQDIMNDDVPF